MQKLKELDHQPLSLEVRVNLARERYKRYFVLSELSHLTSKEVFNKLIGDDETVAQMLRVTDVAKKILVPQLNEFNELLVKLAKDPSKEAVIACNRFYNEVLWRRFTDYYLLTFPCPAPNEHPGVVLAEQRYGLKHISRQPDGTSSVWLSGNPSDLDDLENRYRGKQLVPSDSLTQREAEDVWNWVGTEGLIVHTAGATKLFEYVLSACQQSILHVENDDQAFIEGAKVYEGVISMWFHDHGRMITHDPILHMLVGQLITMDLGLPSYFRRDDDLPTRMQFQKEKPLIEPDDIGGMVKEYKPIALIWCLCDMFSKFIDVIPPEEREPGVHPSSYLRIRMPGSQARFLAWRNSHYSRPELQRSYERQITLMNTVLAWLSSNDSKNGLNVPETTIRNAFDMADRAMRSYMEDEKLSYFLSKQ